MIALVAAFSHNLHEQLRLLCKQLPTRSQVVVKLEQVQTFLVSFALFSLTATWKVVGLERSQPLPPEPWTTMTTCQQPNQSQASFQSSTVSLFHLAPASSPSLAGRISHFSVATCFRIANLLRGLHIKTDNYSHSIFIINIKKYLKCIYVPNILDFYLNSFIQCNP